MGPGRGGGGGLGSQFGGVCELRGEVIATF